MIKLLLAAASKNPVLAPWVAPLQALWPLLWRLLLLASLFALGWHYGGKSAARDLAEQKAQLLEAHIAAVDALRAEERRQDEVTTKVETDYEAAKRDLVELRKRIPTRVVRVCDEATNSGGVPVSSGAADAADRSAQANLSRALGRDIGPALYGLIDECDDLLLKGLGLTQWGDKLSGSKP